VFILLLLPPIAWLGAWLVLVPAILVGAALVIGVIGNAVGHLLR